MKSQKDLAKALDVKVKEHEVKRIQQDDSVRIEISISREAFEKFTRCREHASHKTQHEHGCQSMAAALEVTWDFYLKENNLVSESPSKLSPASKVISRKADKTETETRLQTKEKINKTLTPKTRREIFQRDKCCQYQDPKTGKVCESKIFGQIDHKTSRWANGNHEQKNLQVLCASHNRLKYRKEAQLRWL